MAFKFEKLSILVVEDTGPMLKLIVSVLESLGVGQVYSADNGERGFETFKRVNPDIVISDWHMKPSTGIDLALEIRKNPLSPNRTVPLVLVTGYSAMSRVSEARDAGVTEFLIKPFSANDLAKRIAYVINKPRDFIDLSTYFGPDRRRRVTPGYAGPLRRQSDSNQAQAAQAQ
jgi:two-component system chemotaxis response regulator CheY